MGIIVKFMVVKVFISSYQKEFAEEREFLLEELKNDSFFSETIDIFVFEMDPEVRYLLMKYLLEPLKNQMFT